VLFDGLCAIRELKTLMLVQFPLQLGAMNAPRLAGHGVLLGRRFGDAVHVAIMR
jgi:hypothetical protein